MLSDISFFISYISFIHIFFLYSLSFYIYFTFFSIFFGFYFLYICIYFILMAHCYIILYFKFFDYSFLNSFFRFSLALSLFAWLAFQHLAIFFNRFFLNNSKTHSLLRPFWLPVFFGGVRFVGFQLVGQSWSLLINTAPKPYPVASV